MTSQGLLLLDHCDEQAVMLYESFMRAGFAGPALMLSEDVFLPDGVTSLYRLAVQDTGPAVFPGAVREADESTGDEVRAYRIAHAGWVPGQGRGFNQIEVPDYWEVSADSASGQVHDRNHLRARLFYARGVEGRIVSDVDWLDEGGTVRFTDHYDRAGLLCARTTFNEKGQRFCRSWFDERGRERLVENYVTGDSIVTRDGTTRLFRNRTDLAVALLKERGLEGRRVFYNSLSTPLFVSERLAAAPEGNVLFWQEGPRPDIPGNMQLILNGRSRTSRILVQNAQSYAKLRELGASDDYVRPCGFVYGFERQNAGGSQVLICTNSDRIEGLATLVAGLPQMTFHIAAITEMSSKLMAFGSRPNVRLHPVASKDVLARLFDGCDWYFDINRGSEIVSSVKRAFLHNQLIAGFADTLHRRRYVAPAHVCATADDLVALIGALSASNAKLEDHLALQRETALSEGVETYRRLCAGE
jgi:accessory Sec system glycosyltransferase GtfB